MSTPTGFFAYASQPASVSDHVTAAVERINGRGECFLRPWEQCNMTGHVIISEICKEIDSSEFFCVDLTGLNLNVVFELGFAITTNKRLWPILDSTLPSTKKMLEQLNILSGLAYSPYQNSEDIVSAFFRDQPHKTLDSTVFEKDIKPHIVPYASPTIVYMRSAHNSDAAIAISNFLKAADCKLMDVDPRETASQALWWFGAQVYSSVGVLCHLMNPDRDGAQLNNARCSLVAGMAMGLQKPLLMLAEGPFLAPLDYRNILQTYGKSKEAVQRVGDWLVALSATKTGAQLQQEKEEYYAAMKMAQELKGLQVGEPVAENEEDSLVDEYFIETSAYEDALTGKDCIFVGRKGCGKTANFLKLANSLRKDRANLVCVIKPEGYEIESLVKLLHKYKEADTRGYVIESLWKYLLVTQIANTAAEAIRSRPVHFQPSTEEQEFLTLFDSHEEFRRDFSVRLERQVESVLATQHDSSVEGTRHAISEALHQGVLKDLRLALGKVLAGKRRVAILIDNLDKAWDKRDDLPDLVEVLLGLLRVAPRIPIDFSHKDSRRQNALVTLAVFLRADIFYKLREVEKEPDKLQEYNLKWDDAELLLRVIEERFESKSGGSVAPNELWRRYFCPTVKGIPTKQYFTDTILPRPRDVVFFVKAAIAKALNRKHPRVEAQDIVDAEAEYSKYAVDSIAVEYGTTSNAKLHDLLYELMMLSEIISEQEIMNAIEHAFGVAEQDARPIIDSLCNLSLFGIEVNADQFRFAEDPADSHKIRAMARQYCSRSGKPTRYKIHRAFHAYLETPQEEPAVS